ncbi:hypothetical protein BDZ97DRAFT_1836634 [Flammula alnicola]|nr:hypothetical protein BDZ97DRAFT_1836634 [Flammula alnicola]
MHLARSLGRCRGIDRFRRQLSKVEAAMIYGERCAICEDRGGEDTHLHLIFFWPLCDFKSSDRPAGTIVATNVQTQEWWCPSTPPISSNKKACKQPRHLQVILKVSVGKKAQLRLQGEHVLGHQPTLGYRRPSEDFQPPVAWTVPYLMKKAAPHRP